MSPRPGLAKVRSPRHVSRTTRSFVRTLDGAIRTWIEVADVVSEGSLRPGTPGASYFGSSSILLTWERAPAAELRDPALLPLLENDPHVRVRALRIARREAEARGGELGVVFADLSASVGARGFVICVDVEARVRVALGISRR